MSDDTTLIIADSPLLVSSTDAARLLSVGRSLLLQMDSDGRLGPMPIRFGKRTLWSTKELHKWVEKKCPNRETWQQILAGEKQ